MTMKLNVIEVALTDAQAAELEAAEGNPDATETILKRIADEVMAKQEQQEAAPTRGALLDSVRQLAEKLKAELMRDTLLCIHYLRHEERFEEASMLLCPVAAILEGEKVPTEVLNALMGKLDQINAERAKSSCGGSA